MTIGAMMSGPAMLSAAEAARAIAQGRLTSETLVRACLDRIAECESEIGAWQHLEPELALAAARACDRAPSRGVLHGVPIGVKDVMDTADQPTGYGSRVYEGFRPMGDAACVALARMAGAVVLGKTVSTEFASLSPGKTRNPHNAAHTPGGSSSGSAAAVAAGMVPLGFGTQTLGSIIRPASYCGVVGFKPSFGMVAIAGTKVLAPSLDTIGGLARTVEDIALLLQALTGRPDFAAVSAAERPRIGVYRPVPFDKAEPATEFAIEQAAARLSQAGAAVAERGRFPPYDGLSDTAFTLMNYEGVCNLSWERTGGRERLSPATRRMFEERQAVTPAQYDAALRRTIEARRRLDDFFGDFDAVLVPAAPGEAPAGMTTGDTAFNRDWTLLQVPCITLPAIAGPTWLPVGVQLVGRFWEDARLLAVARFAETALGSWRDHPMPAAGR